MEYRKLPLPTQPWRLFAAAIALAAAGTMPLASAALIDISPTPLASASTGLVKPNVMFIFDSSGSMQWSHAPDDAQPFFAGVGYKTSQCNSIYYNPNLTYPPPKKSDGTDYPNSSFTGAWDDGYAQGSTTNLATKFVAYTATSGSDSSLNPPPILDTPQPAYYYTYQGTFKADPNATDYNNTSGQFYNECNTKLPISATGQATITFSSANKAKVTSVTVNGVTITSGSMSSTSSSTNSIASAVAGLITKAGFSASSSGSTVTITAPDNTTLGASPVVSNTGSLKVTTTPFVKAPFTKVTVGATSGINGTDETQNFANWYSYYRTRILMMKSSAGRAFSTVSTNYRVGFMNLYVSSPSTDSNFVKVRSFFQSQKDDWYKALYAQQPDNPAIHGTPLRSALSNAGRMYGGKFGDDPVQYSCQQNFTILTTDGYWNQGAGYDMNKTAVGNQDYNKAVPYYDKYSTASDTLADVAYYYYNTDLRNQAKFSNCTSPLTGKDVCLDNVPVSDNDNVPWQHMTTFTVGLGVNGTLHFAQDYLTGGSTDYNGIIDKTTFWPPPVHDDPTAVDDLWHSAVNGHGEYFSGKNPQSLVNGLQTALASANIRVAAGAAAATSNLEPVSGDNFAFVANYRTVKWDGDVQARTIDLSTGAISNTPVWSAQANLDAAVSATSDNRKIFTFLGGAQVDFVPASFTAAQKTAWFSPFSAPVLTQSGGWAATDAALATPDTVINFLRGQYGFEERTGNTKLYRLREHVLGDIINGKPVYEKNPPFNYTENNYQSFKSGLSRNGAVYVAANDGMLHAFNATTGDELWAYVPSFVLPNLKALADDSYSVNHQFYVDGSPTVSDVWNGSKWRTILVGGLNAGGKGYYAIDVTDPTTPKVLWEFSDANLGFTFGNPIIGKLADQTWVVVFTSGYNNGDGVGRLYVLDANTGSLKFTISTAVGSSTSPSGLGKVSAWVDDGLNDNTIQRVYGGDMLGNFWRFDVNDSIAPSGKDAFKMAFFQVGGVGQPVTTKPELGLIKTTPMVFVGTGRYLGASDVGTPPQQQQTFYAMRDDLDATPLGDVHGASSCLVQQSLTVIDANTRSTSKQPVDLGVNCGWFLDFSPGSFAGDGERVNVDPKLQLGVLAIATNIPEDSVCTVGGSSFLYFLDYTTGEFVSTMTGQVAGQRIGNSIAVGTNTYRLPDGRVVTTVTTSDDKHPVFGNPDNPLAGSVGKRVLWRELLN